MIEIVESKCPEATALLAQWVDKECGHEQANCDANGDLDHLGSDIETDSVEAIGITLMFVSQPFGARNRTNLRKLYLHPG